MVRHGFSTWADLARAAIRDFSGRPPESSGGVYWKVNPEDFEDHIRLAQELLAKEGHGLTEAWRGEPDLERRAAMRQRAAAALDAAAEFSSLLEKFHERRRTLADGTNRSRAGRRSVKRAAAATPAP